jgi:SAM-dependent methyltransferase
MLRGRMSLVQRILGNPWVFEHVRPLAVGGVDMSHAYRRLGCDDASVVLDIGCGTGDALKHLHRFASYLGIDTDARAIEFATERWKGRPSARFECRLCTGEDLRAGAPTHLDRAFAPPDRRGKRGAPAPVTRITASRARGRARHRVPAGAPLQQPDGSPRSRALLSHARGLPRARARGRSKDRGSVPGS